MSKLITLSNISLESDSYIINNYISVRQHPANGSKTLIESYAPENNTISEADCILFFRAMQLALPMTNIRVERIYNEECEYLYKILYSSTSMLNYYVTYDHNINSFSPSPIILNQKDIQKIRNTHSLIIEHGRHIKQSKDMSKWKPTNWTFAYNQYIQACITNYIETCILLVISALESLLVKSTSELNFRVSLYASLISKDSPEERREVKNLVKKMYDIRSKVAHGDVAGFINKLKNDEIYKEYFSLKEILSDILIKTYYTDIDTLVDNLDNMIFNCPSFHK